MFRLWFVFLVLLFAAGASLAQDEVVCQKDGNICYQTQACGDGESEESQWSWRQGNYAHRLKCGLISCSDPDDRPTIDEYKLECEQPESNSLSDSSPLPYPAFLSPPETPEWCVDEMG